MTETYAQARSGPDHKSRDGTKGKEMDGARVVGTSFEEEGGWQRGPNVVSSKRVYS